jgi:hypothetical protein
MYSYFIFKYAVASGHEETTAGFRGRRCVDVGRGADGKVRGGAERRTAVEAVAAASLYGGTGQSDKWGGERSR